MTHTHFLLSKLIYVVDFSGISLSKLFMLRRLYYFRLSLLFCLVIIYTLHHIIICVYWSIKLCRNNKFMVQKKQCLQKKTLLTLHLQSTVKRLAFILAYRQKKMFYRIKDKQIIKRIVCDNKTKIQ